MISITDLDKAFHNLVFSNCRYIVRDEQNKVTHIYDHWWITKNFSTITRKT